MARRKKSIKIREALTFENVIAEKDGNVETRVLEFFGNDKPVTLEIGCGRGDYSIELAQKNPDRNFIGLDLKPARLWNGAKKATELGLGNILFLYMNAKKLAEEFSKTKFDEIWITFPDPMPKKRQESKRLTAPHYLNIYEKVTTKNSRLHLKTDDDGLYNYTIEKLTEKGISIIKHTDNLYAEKEISETENIKTKYELMHLAEGKTIKLIDFSFTSSGS
jgi:tRNA (guanine-N7-)-methyltransferase